MLLGLQREAVAVDAGVGHTAVVHIGLVLVEVLALLLLEAVLAVQHQLEVVQGAHLHGLGSLTRSVGEHDVGGALLHPRPGHGVGGQAGASGGHGHVGVDAGGAQGVGQGTQGQRTVGGASHVHVGGGSGEVPHAVGGGGGGVGVAPDQLLHWVVERQTDGLGSRGGGRGAAGGGGDAVTTGVLHLLDQVLMALLGEAAALLGVQVHVVGPHLEHGAASTEIVGEVAGQVEVQAHLVVLQGNQGQVQTWVAVEEEQQRQIHAVGVHGVVEGAAGGGELAVVDLLALGEEQLSVQAPPGLVVLVNALTTNGQLNVRHRALSHPAHVHIGVVGGQVGAGQLRWLQTNVHVAHQVAVTGDRHRHAATVGGGAVHRLLDVLHGEVGVTLVHRLEEGHLGLTRQIHVLSTISNELH